MKKLTFLTIFISFFIILPAQEKIATLDAGSGFSAKDGATGYYNKYEKRIFLNTQSEKTVTRFLYDSDFKIVNSYSFPDNTISLGRGGNSKVGFITELITATASYEAYANKDKVVIIVPDFAAKADKIVLEYTLGQFAKDESLLAVLPGDNKLFILTSSFKSDKLFLNTWSPGMQEPEISSFYLPNSNLSGKEEKDSPKEVRIKFSKALVNLTIQPLGETTLMGRAGTRLYYDNNIIYLLMDIPYNFGMYLMKLDLVAKTITGDNYFVNKYEDNSSSVLSKHKESTGLLLESLLVIKNSSDKIIEYSFFNINDGNLVKRYSATAQNIEKLAHSGLRQKGTWGSAKEEKKFDSNKKYLRKSSNGIIYTASADADSITITNLSLVETTGVGGTLLDAFVPLPLEVGGVPMYLTAMLPPLGPSRDKIIYFHTRFSKKDLQPSLNKNVTTTVDDLLDDKKIETLSANSSFVIKKNGVYFIGFYSKELQKIEVFKYNGE